LISRSFKRALMLTAVLAGGLALAGCNGENLSTNAKAMRPVPEKLVADMQTKDMDLQSPILVRLFKQEAELEVWKQDRSGRYALLKTYPICRWSGDLGPKVREGDRQAPEGFYSITPAQMNPASSYYLSFNIGYPNAYDRAWGRTGSQLMVHGDCSSRGCYAMTDEQISEIYALGRESFFGGQRAFQVQAYPFRMTPQNMARHRNNPNMPFWKMLKEGWDHFEVTRQEPKVDVCEKRYVFDAEQPANASRPLTFNPTGACPAYQMSPEVADAVRDKQRQDEIKTAELISRGTPQARSRAGIDGGMHPIFASKLPPGETTVDTDGDYTIASYLPAPGTIPPTVNPPRPAEPQPGSFLSIAPEPAPPKLAATGPSGNTGGTGFLASLAQKVGIGNDTTASTQVPAPAPAKPVIAAAPKKPAAASTRPAETRTAESKTAEKPPTAPKVAAAKPAAASGSDAQTSLAPAQTLAGAAPVMPANSFESRWGSIR
jgi:murein L,D-transpeptidase YafK